ncbi:MAG: hypothetical protein KC506_02710 [Nanoarchaeota archaeon]|nr:hypothetical protein [Nanoarchaeota archaeon]
MNIKNLVLGIGIVIVFALTLWQGIEAFYPSPQWDDFCGNVERQIPQNPGQPEKLEFPDYTECQEQYEAAQQSHSQAVFFTSLIVALLAIIVGHAILKVEPVGSALIASGIWSIFWGTVVNWRNFTSVIRFALLILALVLLIWLTLRFNKPKKKK